MFPSSVYPKVYFTAFHLLLENRLFLSYVLNENKNCGMKNKRRVSLLTVSISLVDCHIHLRIVCARTISLFNLSMWSWPQSIFVFHNRFLNLTSVGPVYCYMTQWFGRRSLAKTRAPPSLLIFSLAQNRPHPSYFSRLCRNALASLVQLILHVSSHHS